MTASAIHPLSSLIGPLRYACQRQFAQLATVRGLRPLLEKALMQSERAGLEPRVLASLRRELPTVDHASLEVRRESLRRVLSQVLEAGVALPNELRAITGHPPVATNAVDLPLFERASSTALEEREEAPAGSPMVPPAAPKPPRRKAKSSQPSQRSSAKAKREASAKEASSTDEARLLSIAPREGPLAVALKSAGGRINPRLLSALYRKGVRRVGDVLFMLPRVYEDRRRMRSIAQLVPGERGVTVGEVRTAGEGPPRRGRRTFRAVVADHSGSIAATYFQSGPWLKAKFPIGRRVVISGEVRASSFGREIPHPEVEPADDLEQSSVHFNRIVPVYSGFERHEQRALRELTYRVAAQYAQHIDDPLPEGLRRKLDLMGLSEAVQRIHFPRESDDLEAYDRHQSAAHQRLAFDELFFLQLGISLKRKGAKAQPGIAFNISEERLTQAKQALPFALTRAQARVVKQICADLARPEPMNRLLQGDVGSGKTAVAVVSSLIALQDGYQVGLMAPTEILAEQHYRTFQKLLRPLGFEVGLVTASGTGKQRKDVRQAIAEGRLQMAVGTHALIQDEVAFDRLGLVVIDEQHRFGVIQRHALMSKGHRPDFLVMTATPIPRTLAMTMYGDLDVSVIDELPPGRTPILTKVYSDRARDRVYQAMEAELAKGHQAYVVYPLVEESEKVDMADATRGAQDIAQAFPQYQVGLLHGRLRPEEKDAVMGDFRSGKTRILVCTTVVEVGVDVPNASIMVIESAERFGLSQLHQLRGRVGRGAAASFCFLIAGYARSRESSDRLAVMEQSNDGFVIAEKDLELRGPGEFLGTRQSGMPELAVANLTRDQHLLSIAQEEARVILDRDPQLRLPENRPLVKALDERWEGRLSLAQVG